MVSSLQHQPPSLLATEAAVTVNHVTPPPANDPVVRKQAVQDLMAQMQGTYNFMQVNRPEAGFSVTKIQVAVALSCTGGSY